ncbi:hypothetical protein ET989_10705 [Propioniciclava sinopodophylli]|uniref:Uncharacterized protein n=1 Tax=Propioniciclava sinopodophylli TaxID=1837344 RepID=A0A4Q9KEB0_9ACTN|nr:hypothetical protein [Propioniciclava sinopodophylli]TBT83778.1 hypothetical protein ET989_10705 [Propioniciclava sinopodophylli]
MFHWGADLGELDAEGLSSLAAATAPVVAPCSPDAPVRVSLVPEASTGYTGRPGLTGSRAGRARSPRWVGARSNRAGASSNDPRC